MAKHQIIYTSCMRGIDGVNDGQQIYSYDEAFRDGRTEDIKSLFTYQVPSLPQGILMSEEIAKTMPTAFVYRMLKDGSASVTLNTYLGRDYMGSAGRFGNHLSHSVICDFDDFDIYPCELYGGTVLRSSMEYEEVNNPNPPAYLPTPELVKGYVIDPESIIEFLGVEDHLERYKQMVAAMLRFQTDKKRIIICDEPDNIVKWIAALHYTLPLDIAKKVNFTTYEYDPELSSAQICGVLSEGSRYNCGSYIASDRHVVFDFINNQFTDIGADNILMDFLDTAFSFSYESLLDFHSFVMNSTTYRECNEKYYVAYYLYNLLSEGISDINKEQFGEIAGFAEEFLTVDVKKEYVTRLLDERDYINRFDSGYALEVLESMLHFFDIMDSEQQNIVKQMIVDRLILSLSEDVITEEVFLPLYDNIDNLARSINLSIPAELMVSSNRASLLGVLSQGTLSWKVFFVIRIISDYVKDMKLPVDELRSDRSIGAIYYGVTDNAYRNGRSNDCELVERILDSFKTDNDYYSCMGLNLDGFLTDIGAGDEVKKHLWKYFCDEVLKMDEDSVEVISKKLGKNKRFTELYYLFNRQLVKFSSFSETKDFFEEYWHQWFLKNDEYAAAYAAPALKSYAEIFERNIKSFSDKERLNYSDEILNMAIGQNITDSFVSHLIEARLDDIPIGKLNADNKSTISKLYKYTRDVLNKPIDGKLLILFTAIQLNRIFNQNEIATTTREIKDIAVESGVNLDGLSDGKVKDYFEWAFDALGEFSLVKEDYEAIYGLFDFSENIRTLFMEYWCKVSYKDSKGEKNYTDFAEYLKFLFASGRNDDQEMVGKYLCKLSKQKLEELDDEMSTVYFLGDRKAIRAWENVRDIASRTNPLLNNLFKVGNLFRKK